MWSHYANDHKGFLLVYDKNDIEKAECFALDEVNALAVEGDEDLKGEMIRSVDEQGEIVIYQSDNGRIHIDVKMEGETIWLTQNQLGELYQTSKSNVSEHIKHIFEEGELEEDSVVRKFRTTASDGKNYNVTYYNLDLIISLGYRIKSGIATKFRRWASERIKEYIIKGFTMDDERLKSLGGGDYWKELAEIQAMELGVKSKSDK